MYKRILVPLDGSPLAEAALSHAEGLARQFGSEVVLLRVVVSPYAIVAPDLVLAGYDFEPSAICRSGRAILERRCRQAGSSQRQSQGHHLRRPGCRGHSGPREGKPDRPDRDVDPWPRRRIALGLRQRRRPRPASRALSDISCTRGGRMRERCHVSECQVSGANEPRQELNTWAFYTFPPLDTLTLDT